MRDEELDWEKFVVKREGCARCLKTGVKKAAERLEVG